MVNDPTLYPPEFVIKHGVNEPHWELENWQKRERSLLHDMICILLANLEPSHSLEEVILNNLKRRLVDYEDSPPRKRRKQEESTFSGIECTSVEGSEDESNSSDSESCEDDDDDNYDYDPIAEFEKNYEEILKYRYIVLEGLVNASEIQSHFMQKWNMEANKVFDIIDTKEKKFIEVKTTTNLPRILEDYSSQSSTCVNTALITVELNENVIDVHNKVENMPGESKAYNFLLKRKAIMKTLGLEDRETDEFGLTELVFKPEYIVKTLELMEDLFMKNIQEDVDLKDVDIKGFKIEPITSEKLFEYLRKPLLEKYDKVCDFKGKLTPFFFCDARELEDERDVIAVDTFFVDLHADLQFISGDFELFSAVQYFINKWMESDKESKNFGFINIALKSEKEQMPVEAKESLMIGKKGKTYNNNIDRPIQKERELIQNKGYPSWFELLYEIMSKQSEIGKGNQPRVEERSKIPLYGFLGDWVNNFIEEVSKRNVGVYIDQIANFYSRISGTYNTTIGNKTTHSNIAAIPLKINTEVEGVKKRWITGVCIRGPHHMRSATDKSNLLIIEKIKDINSIPEYFYDKKTLFKTGTGFYMVRKTAVKKIDGIHLTFIRNSLFIACNMIGDIIMKHKQFMTEGAFKILCTSHLTNERSLNFFIDRVIDATLMATIGNTRDEGYFSMFRKFFMILLNRRRQQNSFTFDLKGMCEKLNECLIDNPLSMFFQNSLLYMICDF